MATPDLQRPFPDYVTCPHCGEPEVEVWCYDLTAQCHACAQIFAHALPLACGAECDRSRCEAQHPPAFHFHPVE
jgi:hypothetical protein